MRVALCFVNFGPYHMARLRACLQLPQVEVVGVQLAKDQAEYPWSASVSANVESIMDDRSLESVPVEMWKDRVASVLSRINPTVCAIAGYSHPGMLAILDWCNQNGRPAMLMSDSTALDEVRRWWKEALKQRLLRRYSAAFVAGSRHREYLASLGFHQPVSLGYDAVDNAHFFRNPDAGHALRPQDVPAGPFFLALARFVEKKNLFTLLRAYAQYREVIAKAGSTSPRPSPQSGEGIMPWKLVVLGDGPLRRELEDEVKRLQLCAEVFMPGFKQYDELPAYYGSAAAFIHASTSEQWGLVVNEALASSLPVIVSERCGCAPELVHDGVNGFTFDPFDRSALSVLMQKMAELPETTRSNMGMAGRRIIEGWGLEQFADGLRSAAESATRVGPRRASWLDDLLLRALIKR